MKRDEIVRLCDQHSNETVTLRKQVSKHKNMRKWMIEFLRKFENRGIKIAPINSILINKSINLKLFTVILYDVGGPLRFNILKLTVSAQSINREVYDRK